MPTNNDRTILLYKQNVFELDVAGAHIGGYYKGNSMNNIPNSPSYSTAWHLFTMIHSFTASSQTITLLVDGTQANTQNYSEVWTDSSINKLILGRYPFNRYFIGFVHSLTFYDGIVPNSDFQAGVMFTFFSGKITPLTESSDLSTNTDPLDNKDGENCVCGSNTSCLEDDDDCIECSSGCNNFCTYSSCINPSVYCAPHTYNTAARACDWNLLCSNNCYQCDTSTCYECDSGYYMTGSSCSQCHADCSTCSGPTENDCLSCNDSLRIPILGSGCECMSGYFQNTSSTCVACNQRCSFCNGPSENDCLECNGANHILVSGSCVCDSGFYENPSNFLECLSCVSGCTSCTGPQIEDCSECVGSNQVRIGGICECESGFYESSSSPLECMACDSNCSECSGPLSTECTECFGVNQHVDSEGRCSCNSGFYESSSNPLECMACHSDCSKCSGPLSTDCIECSGLNQHVDSGGGCSCNSGFYESSSSPFECMACHSDCSKCSGPLSTDCIECSGLNQHVDSGGGCSCNSGFYESSSSLLECMACHSECSECSGPSSNECLECSDPNSSLQNAKCSCNNGFYPSSSSSSSSASSSSSSDSFECKPCPSDCPDCLNLSSCSDCPSPNSYVLDGECTCSPGFYRTSSDPLVCDDCPSYCSICSQGHCTECSESSRDPQNECKCKQDYCENEEGKCEDCLKDAISELSQQGKASAGGVAGGIALGFVSMITFDDPTVLWTITNIAQFVSYLPVLSVPLSQTAYEFLISYKTAVFLPNVFLDLIPLSKSKAPLAFRRFGKHLEEFEDTQFLRNAGRLLLIIVLTLCTYLGMYGISFIIPKKGWREKVRTASREWMSTLFKIWLTLFLDIFVVLLVSLFDSDSEKNFLSAISTLIFGKLCLISPFFLWRVLSRETDIREEKEPIMRYVGQVFKPLNLESKYSLYFELLMWVRRLCFGIGLYAFCTYPAIFLTTQIGFSILFILYIFTCKVFKTRRSDYINIIAEIVLLLSFTGLLAQYFIGFPTNIEYGIIGANICLILGISLFNFIFGSICYFMNRRITRKQVTTVINKPKIEINSPLENREVIFDNGNMIEPNGFRSSRSATHKVITGRNYDFTNIHINY